MAFKNKFPSQGVQVGRESRYLVPTQDIRYKKGPPNTFSLPLFLPSFEQSYLTIKHRSKQLYSDPQSSYTRNYNKQGFHLLQPPYNHAFLPHCHTRLCWHRFRPGRPERKDGTVMFHVPPVLTFFQNKNLYMALHYT